ncbi:MAG: glycosyltransferase family 39 protein [Saprospiraceae bacterium]
MKNNSPPIYWRLILGLALLKLILHLSTNGNYSYHRDELLYIALGNHLDTGYWSNGPMIGWISWFIQHTIGNSPFAVRLIPSILGGGLVVLAALMAREMGGGKWAQAIAGLSIMVSPLYLRASSMFQPVIFDIFCWTIFTFLLLRFIQTQDKKYILWFGIAFGLGLLNKYSVGFYLLALLPALLFTPYRQLLWKKETGMAALAALLLFAPNIFWQYTYHFPVVNHMQALSASQLVNVNPVNFMLDQLLFNLPALFLLFGGLFFLFSVAGKPYRLIGWLFVWVLILFLVLRGKSYYTAGIYPVLLAAGAVGWEKWGKAIWIRIAIPSLMVLLILPLLPMGLPILPLNKMVSYCHWLKEDLGLDAPMRWENGRVYDLPQDYADMNGWEELAQNVIAAYQSSTDPATTIIYAENYGQAGAIDLFGKRKGLPSCNSFADTYRLWVDGEASPTALIYVNDELGADVAALFEDIQQIGTVQSPYAREKGTMIFLCQKGRANVAYFWQQRVHEIQASWQ